MSSAIQGDRPHSNPGFRTILLSGVEAHGSGVVEVDVDEEVLEVAEDNVELIVGLQEQAELYREAAVPQAADALLGKPVVIVLTEVVKVAQKAASEEYAARLWVGKRARRQLNNVSPPNSRVYYYCT